MKIAITPKKKETACLPEGNYTAKITGITTPTDSEGNLTAVYTLEVIGDASTRLQNKRNAEEAMTALSSLRSAYTEYQKFTAQLADLEKSVTDAEAALEANTDEEKVTELTANLENAKSVLESRQGDLQDFLKNTKATVTRYAEHNVILTDQWEGTVREYRDTMETLGETLQSLLGVSEEDLEDFDFEPSELVGKLVDMLVVHETLADGTVNCRVMQIRATNDTGEEYTIPQATEELAALTDELTVEVSEN